MLKKVKSSYIVLFLFSYVSERQKLKMTKYNKNLQHILERRLIHYKIFSGRRIEYEQDGKGKEYLEPSDRLIYEGEYLKGERNGKGKEYDYFGKLEFEGEFLNGKRNGKGKEYKYDYLGICSFKSKIDRKKVMTIYVNEGEFLNNKIISGISYSQEGNLKKDIKIIKQNKNEKKEDKHLSSLKDGKGKEYDSDGHLIFEGEYLKGERNGKGKEYTVNIYNYGNKFSLIYEGYYLNGERNGKGKEYSPYNGNLIYEGEYLKGEKNGKGKKYNDYGNLI